MTMINQNGTGVNAATSLQRLKFGLQKELSACSKLNVCLSVLLEGGLNYIAIQKCNYSY